MQNKKIKITFVLPSLVAGGAERIMSFIAQELNKDKFETTLLVVGFEKDSVYQVEKTKAIYLNKERVLHSITGLYKHFKKEKPDIVMSSIVHLNTMVALISVLFPKIKFVAREANVLSVLIKYNHYSKLIFPKFLTVIAYKLIDCIVCQSNDMKADMVKSYGVSEKKLELINNPITNNFKLKTEARKSKDLLNFITVARLSKEKGHERLIDVLSKITFPFHYNIIGDGIEKEYLLDLIKKNGLVKKVTHIPYTKNVSEYLTNSDVFLQGSYVEGFPNVLIESCVVGTPVVAFNAPGGLDEIIENGANGFIVNSIDEYAECLHKLYDNFSFKPTTVCNIVTERFNKNKIVNNYETLFLNLMQNAH